MGNQVMLGGNGDRPCRSPSAQQIVWLQGRHLPQAITLARGAGGDAGGHGARGGPADQLELVAKPPAPAAAVPGPRRP
jgi:hypothetical protein